MPHKRLSVALVLLTVSAMCDDYSKLVQQLLPQVRFELLQWAPFCFDKYCGELCNCGRSHVYPLAEFTWLGCINEIPLSEEEKKEFMVKITADIYSLNREQFIDFYKLQ